MDHWGASQAEWRREADAGIGGGDHWGAAQGEPRRAAGVGIRAFDEMLGAQAEERRGVQGQMGFSNVMNDVQASQVSGIGTQSSSEYGNSWDRVVHVDRTMQTQWMVLANSNSEDTNEKVGQGLVGDAHVNLGLGLNHNFFM